MKDIRLSLTPHPDTPCSALDRLEVEASRHGRRTSLTYYLYGDIPKIKGLPSSGGHQSEERQDELWRTTCLEAFFKAKDEDQYVEMNFSPKGAWAAYLFDSYREGMRNAIAETPRIAAAFRGNSFALSVVLKQPADLPVISCFSTALTAVIETKEGQISHWSLKHPDGPADFHSLAGFVHKLPY